MAADGVASVVGEEKGITELLLDSDVLPLLQGLRTAGASSARLLNSEGDELWAVRDPARLEGKLCSTTLSLEGEPVGILQLSGEPGHHEELCAMARLAGVALESVLKNSLKRVLTTEIHATVVHSSFEELLESNSRLAQSEARYRELAQTLETRVKERSADLKKAHAHILQQQKMVAIGQLAAGVAHEINNPLSFISSNLQVLHKYVGRLSAMLHFYREQLQLGLPTESVAAAAEGKWQELKLQLVCKDIGDLLSESISGAERIARIIADLKGFSHVDEAGEVQVDLNRELELTLGVLGYELKDRVEIVRDLQPLPPICCLPQLAGQIFLNIMRNALSTRADGLRIALTSSCDGERIRVSIADNGPGVPEEIRGRIFEPFFTTKGVGGGTGMGLALVYEAVLKLGGAVAVTDAPKGGANFIITIPIGKG